MNLSLALDNLISDLSNVLEFPVTLERYEVLPETLPEIRQAEGEERFLIVVFHVFGASEEDPAFAARLDYLRQSGAILLLSFLSEYRAANNGTMPTLVSLISGYLYRAPRTLAPSSIIVEDDEGSMGAGEIVGMILGIIFAIFLIGLCFYCFCCYGKGKNSSRTAHTNTERNVRGVIVFF